MRKPLCCLGLLSVLPVMAQAATTDAGDTGPAAMMRRIAAEPFRYGGSVSGLPIGDRRDLSLAIGLDGPRPDGALRGEAILFDASRHLVASGTIQGSLRADPAEGGTVPGIGRCHLVFAFPAGRTTLDGTCTADVIAGRTESSPRPAGFVGRLIAWWGDRAVDGQAWLTAASFDR